MKKILCALLCAVMLCLLVGCGNNSDKPAATGTNGSSQYEGNVDVDLTQLSSTMVYSEVYNIVTNPSEYEGKVVKMDGTFATYHDEVNDKYYFACIIADATACCSQGLEFELAGNYDYPKDYPELDTNITVTGVFHTYMEDDTLYCHLTDAELVL